MKTQKSADIVTGLFLAALGLVVLFAARGITGGLEERLPPRTLPYAMGLTIFVTGGLLALKSWRFKGENPLIKWPDRTGKIRVLINLVALIAYIFLIDPLGMPIATFLYMAFSVWYLREGRYRIVVAVATGLISAAMVLYLFMKFLELNFPMGLLQP
jgi:hypothetical protein